MHVVEEYLNSVIDRWNLECKAQGIEKEYQLKISCRKKKLFLNRIDFLEKHIAEISFIVKGEKSYLLWNRQMEMPAKVKNTPEHKISGEYVKRLLHDFLFECVGNFAIMTEHLIKERKMAEYDIERDRLKADDSAPEGMIIKTLKGGEFFEEGNEFDVFAVTDDAYHVYTAHKISRNNNGIAKILKADTMVLDMGKVKILSLSDVK